ncbi:transmembrane protein 214-A [Daphnia magna]|uniref:transmembrane protein 214-A n=1 Tax=Daphnia magna TaxID=35525 RepID=UPI001E1BD0F1|nr:transmembrane protein 214-A [Daphnia magna]XP_045034318.1 transmembrane protein 214-A [Daphnia magna]XP_045034319.1 transmembrane protein 214-A [Daphnia magna]
MYDDEYKNPGQWEVVGGKTSSKPKGKTATNKMNGAGTKSGAAPKPIIKVDELVTPLDTKYALLDPQLRAKAKQDALGVPDKPASKSKPKPASTTVNKDVVKKKPSKEVVKEKVPKSLPEALKQINTAELSSAMTTVKARFSSSRLLWLKELASYLNNHTSTEIDPVFSGKSRDYPSNILSSELKTLITSTIQFCDDEALSAFFDQSLITMPSEMNRGVSVSGTKIVLQLLSFHRPTVVLAHLARANEILAANESNKAVTLSILWVLSQSSFKDSRVGIQVWMETMLPLISMKNYCAYVAQNAEYLASKTSSMKSLANSLTVADYFKLVEQVQQGTVPTTARKEVANLVQSLSQPMISAHGSKMFMQYLRKLVSDPSGRADMSKKMVSCLRADAHSYESWRKEYRSNLLSSSCFLQWVTDNEQTFARESQDFQATLCHFQTINSTYSPTSKPQQGLNGCIQLCEYLMGSKKNKKKPTRSGSKLKYLNYVMLIALAYLVYYDTRVYGDGQFINSRLGKAAERSGITAKALELHQIAQPYLAEAEDRFVLLRDVVYRKAGEIHQRAEPYLAQVGDGMVQLKNVVYRKGEELYPGIWDAADEKYQALVLVTKEKAALGYAMAVEYTELGMEAGAKYWGKFQDWSAVYRQQLAEQTEKVIELTGGYVQCARKTIAEFMEKEQVQHALKYSYDMYHKALHAVGLCSH